MKTYNSYHTIIKQLAKKDKIHETYLACIERTTIWRWKKEPIDPVEYDQSMPAYSGQSLDVSNQTIKLYFNEIKKINEQIGLIKK